jgi:NAD(P)-dependent dehydrogenase (short-subunit alcohol dehydrogenase family)
MNNRLLKNKITLVSGASRGVGRRIAQVLGKQGATVYVSGRSTAKGGSTKNLPGTVEETARLVTEAGGIGIAVHCDHTNDGDVEALFQKI